jgi:hypothetical protein
MKNIEIFELIAEFPEILILQNVPQFGHDEDAFQHTLYCLHQLNLKKFPDYREHMAYAMLFHDIGKAFTLKRALFSRL